MGFTQVFTVSGGQRGGFPGLGGAVLLMQGPGWDSWLTLGQLADSAVCLILRQVSPAFVLRWQGDRDAQDVPCVTVSGLGRGQRPRPDSVWAAAVQRHEYRAALNWVVRGPGWLSRLSV